MGMQVLIEKSDVLIFLKTPHTGILTDVFRGWANTSFSAFEPEILKDVRPYLKAVINLWSTFREFDSAFTDMFFNSGDGYPSVPTTIRNRSHWAFPFKIEAGIVRILATGFHLCR